MTWITRYIYDALTWWIVATWYAHDITYIYMCQTQHDPRGAAVDHDQAAQAWHVNGGGVGVCDVESEAYRSAPHIFKKSGTFINPSNTLSVKNLLRLY